MRILLVGAGGVGGAFAAIAARRDFFEQIVIADYDPAKAETAAAADDRFVGAQHRRLRRGGGRAALCREHGITHVMNAVDPVFNMPLFDGAFAAGADYVDMAMSLSQPHPEAPYEKTGVKLGDEQFAVADEWEARRPAGAGRDRRRARAVRRLRAVRRRPPLQRDRRARHPRRRQPGRHRRRRQRGLRAVVLDVDDDRGVPQPAGDLGGRRAGTRRRRSPSRRSSTSPRASVRSSASTSSTRRCSSCRAGSTASGRPSSTASATSSSPSSRCCTRSASTAPRRSRSRASRSAPATWSPPCCPTPRPSARG